MYRGAGNCAINHDGPAARNEQVLADGTRNQAPQPACSPPTRSSMIFEAHPDRR
jgi:hypothetical protein